MNEVIDYYIGPLPRQITTATMPASDPAPEPAVTPEMIAAGARIFNRHRGLEYETAEEVVEGIFMTMLKLSRPL